MSSDILLYAQSSLSGVLDTAADFLADRLASPHSLLRPLALSQVLLSSLAVGTAPKISQNLTNALFESTAGIQAPSFTYSFGKSAICLNGKIGVTAEASNAKIDLSVPSDQRNATGIVQQLLQTSPSIYGEVIKGPNPISGTWDIFSRLCLPADPTAASKVSTVQILTHGSTLDGTYWDFADNYSYIDAAAEAGFATFSYDRLGVSKSAHPDPIEVVQAALQVEILHQMILKLRATPGIGGKQFKKFVGVGHSAGSAFTQAVTRLYPDDFDAVVLTGITTSLGSVPTAQGAMCMAIANQQGARFSGLQNGYFTIGSGILGIQLAFFQYPYFDPAILKKQAKTIATNTIGEQLTFGSIFAPATAYTKPVFVYNGDQDFVFCGGNCVSPVDLSAAALAFLYPSLGDKGKSGHASKAGHNLFQHLGAKDQFKTVIEFLRENGF